MAHGYVDCACRDCFEIAVCSAPAGEECKPEDHLCSACEEAGCDPAGKGECLVIPELDLTSDADVGD